ncbi:nuclear condensin complex subunit [Grosmannia clavigera kw1407]|uniref:Structural maintenance of chromosomes protein n=1 Tax=Grosmannia clavigera (strain kw1407 / UAMH 11150) TaxID=655863 RepID=F0XG25_GROCL|nr:nuclear condensin complex subunit [Grosmannia clavigera kw1407]EFX03364.1 nuclear condensin complex subunit [Grosmannia clavigera kw1407]
MSTRPTRRAASRRTAIIESDDEIADTSVHSSAQNDDEEAFTPAPPRSPRRATTSRRKTIATEESASAPKKPGRPRKARASASASTEQSELIDPDRTVASMASSDAPDLAPKKTVTRKRKSVASSSKSVAVKSETSGLPELSELSEAPVSVPRRRKTASVEPADATTMDASTMDTTAASDVTTTSAPLVDITATVANGQQRPATATTDEAVAAMKPIRAMDALLEKPMDIVLKSRTMTNIPSDEPAAPKPRIVIAYLILTNFKSYAGRQEVGPFHASFSSVVGPNGSGKSNVIDSLLFVFGFRASKMRQGKLSALIHNSAQYPNLDYCEVAVHFREVMDLPGGGSEAIPSSDLVISRKAFRNNSSTYYIDGKSSNFTTVTTLLRDRGVDLDHKRFLILQGEVESIAQMKPKAGNEHEDGLLEYLEDIIGTSKYKTPIEEAANEVETLNDICMEKSGRVQHVEKEKHSLEDKKDKAIAYVRDENELAMKQSALYQIYIGECTDNVAVTKEAISQMQAELDAELEKHHGSEQEIKQLEKAYSKGSRQCDAQEKETQQLLKDMAKFDQERVKYEEKRKFLGDKRKKLEKAIATAENSAATAAETVEQCTEEIGTRAEEMAQLEKQIKEEEAELTSIRDSLKGKTQAFSDQIAAKQKSLEPWKDKINQKQSAIAVAESELAILQEKATAGATALEEMQAKIGSIEKGRAAKAAELQDCQLEKGRLEKEAKKVEAELASLAQQEPKMRAQLSNARQKADEARSSLSQTQTQGNVLTALMRMRESGRIDGFHGRLGNLGTIDQQYDVAISTACPALDNFVTDTVEAGQQCIEYLRKTNLGRGNFICLDKLRVRDMAAMQTPEKAPRLFDLIRAKDERFRPAFYHALQDTLVAKDLAQANRIAYGAKRWRVVTLDGELIDKSGTMSGGGTTTKKGLMSSKLVADTSKEQVARLEVDRDGLEQRFAEFQERQRELEGRLRFLGEQIPQMETTMQKLSLELDSAARNLADAQRRMKELGREQQPSSAGHDSKRALALEKEVGRLGAESEQLHGEMASVEAEIQRLQDKIMEVGGEKLRAQRTMIEALKEELASHNEETSNAEVRRAKAEKQMAKLEKDRAKAGRELEAAQQELEQLEAEIQNQGDKAESLQTAAEAARESLVVKKQVLAEVKAELDEKMAELNTTRGMEIDMRNKLEENQKVLVENEKQLRYWENKLSKLRLQDIHDLERAKVKVEGGEGGDEGAGEVASEPADKDQPIKSEGTGDSAGTPPLELTRYSPDELAGMQKQVLQGEIAALEEKTQNASVDLGVLAEYRRRVEEHAARSSDLASAVGQRDTAKRRCDDLRRLRLEGFMEGFGVISLRLKEMYQMITMGGNAELELVDSLDPFSEGILFSVMPPKKSWKNISNLSGGEKTLSSLALVFALHHYKPTPLYVMDEIDAALDFRNVSIVANYIKERTKNAQFIVISLRNNMFELAARLVGVYKVNHMTKSVTIENRDYITRLPVRPGPVGVQTPARPAVPQISQLATPP